MPSSTEGTRAMYSAVTLVLKLSRVRCSYFPSMAWARSPVVNRASPTSLIIAVSKAVRGRAFALVLYGVRNDQTVLVLSDAAGVRKLSNTGVCTVLSGQDVGWVHRAKPGKTCDKSPTLAT